MGYKVLLADDSITVQKIVKLSLTEEGIEVIAVGNGEQAVQQLETLRPDLVMADVFMPGKDGYEVCEFVKAHPQLKNIPVILLVHAFEPFDPDRAKKVGADHQLTKPFQSIRTLVTTVQEMLQAPAGAEAMVSSNEQVSDVSTPPAVVARIFSQPAITQPEEEFAVVSSLTTAVNPQAESDVSFDATAMSGFAATPTISVFDASFAIPEPGLPVPLTAGGGFPKADLLPPPELPVLSPTEWQPTTPLQSEWQSVAPVLSPIPQAEPLSSSFAPLSLAPNAMTMEPLAMDSASEDVLELSDVLLPDTGGATLTVATSRANQFASDMPLLAVLGTSSALTEEIPTNTPATESNPATFAESFDVAVGHVAPPTEVIPVAQTSPVQDVNVGTVFKSDEVAALHIPEAVIEEIVNRVIQRLSTNAIQEIAWEVVPEMAELLIRKQISQQQQLAH